MTGATNCLFVESGLRIIVGLNISILSEQRETHPLQDKLIWLSFPSGKGLSITSLSMH